MIAALAGGFDAATIKRIDAKWKFDAKARAEFYTDLAAFDAAGITPFDALADMRTTSARRKSMKWLHLIVSSALVAAANGAGFAQAMRKWVPPEEATMLMAGEESGNMREVLRELAELLHSKVTLQSSIRKHMLSAIGSIVGLAVLMVYILKTVMEEARPQVPDHIFAKLKIAPAYFAIGEWVTSYILYVGIGLIVLAAIVIWSLPNWTGNQVRMTLDARVPPWSFYRRIQAVFFLISVASMMRGGQPFRQAVENVRRFASPWARHFLGATLRRLAAGQNEIESLKTGFLPWDVEDRLAIYARLPDFRSVMTATARDSMKKLLERVDRLGFAIDTAAKATIAVFILFSVASIGEIALESQSNYTQTSSGN